MIHIGQKVIFCWSNLNVSLAYQEKKCYPPAWSTQSQNLANTHGRPIVDTEVTTFRAQKTTDYFRWNEQLLSVAGSVKNKKGESEEKSNVSISTPFNCLCHPYFQLWSCFTYFSRVDVLNFYHDPTRGMTSQMSPLLWTFFSPSVVTWHTTRPSESAHEEVWVILFSRAENTDALFYLSLQPRSYISS